MLTPRIKSPPPEDSKEGWTRDTAQCRIVSLTHYRLSYSSPNTDKQNQPTNQANKKPRKQNKKPTWSYSHNPHTKISCQTQFKFFYVFNVFLTVAVSSYYYKITNLKPMARKARLCAVLQVTLRGNCVSACLHTDLCRPKHTFLLHRLRLFLYKL